METCVGQFDIKCAY